MIGIFDLPSNVTGFTIGYNYKGFPLNIVGALRIPFTMYISSKNSIDNNIVQFKKIYNVIFENTLFLYLLISGILYFFLDFFLYFVYGESYLYFSFIIQLMLFSSIFISIRPLLFTFLRGTNRFKYITPISLAEKTFEYSIFFFLLIFFGLAIALIGSLICSLILFLVFYYLNIKIFEIKLNIKKAAFSYLAFFLSIGIIIIIEHLFLNNLTDLIVNLIKLEFLKHLRIYSIILFIILFVFLNIKLKVFRQNDIEYITKIINKKKKFNRLILKGLNLFKKLLKN
ncbi:MAG: hypothetical protein ACTSRH_06760 [Promethearchaeota archaeon]